MKGIWENPAAAAAESKKPRPNRRSNRRPRQTPGGVYEPVERCTGAFISLPAMHVNGGGEPMEAGVSMSCPLPGYSSVPFKSRKCMFDPRCVFDPYWSEEAVEEAIKNGAAFQAKFRVNAHNHQEAYCTIEGVPTDVLINGAIAQNRAVIVSEARVVGLGPRFMSVYINKLGIERRVYYADIEGLIVEWLESTCTLVLDLFGTKPFRRRGYPSKFRPIEEAALVMNPSEETPAEEDTNLCEATTGIETSEIVEKSEASPAFFPLVLKNLSAVPVALHAIGGDNGPLDIGVRLYMCSYFKRSDSLLSVAAW